MEEEHRQILKMVAEAKITVEEAARLLEAVEPQEIEEQGQASAPAATPVAPGSNWAHFWIYPLMAGGIVLILGAMIVSLVYTIDAARGWLVCGWLPMILGTIVILLAGWSRQARWIHLRITEQGKRKMALSFPLPLSLTAWVLRIAQPFVPRLKETGVDDLIIAVRDHVTQDVPLFMEVQDDPDGERVELYIG